MVFSNCQCEHLSIRIFVKWFCWVIEDCRESSCGLHLFPDKLIQWTRLLGRSTLEEEALKTGFTSKSPGAVATRLPVDEGYGGDPFRSGMSVQIDTPTLDLEVVNVDDNDLSIIVRLEGLWRRKSDPHPLFFLIFPIMDHKIRNKSFLAGRTTGIVLSVTNLVLY